MTVVDRQYTKAEAETKLDLSNNEMLRVCCCTTTNALQT